MLKVVYKIVATRGNPVVSSSTTSGEFSCENGREAVAMVREIAKRNYPESSGWDAFTIDTSWSEPLHEEPQAEKPKDEPIKIGDVVRLKGSSNSPRMTVMNYTTIGEFVCGWFGPLIGGQTSFNTIAVRQHALERAILSSAIKLRYISDERR